MSKQGLVVERVSPGSIAHRMGVEPGDRVLKINGRPVRDLIDYRFYTCGERLQVDLRKHGGQNWLLDVEKDYEDDLGLVFSGSALGRIRRCRNRCIFCFLDQMPKGLRASLYFNDDDYRLSFTEGNFVTLTNVTRADLERIAEQRLSPLYVSVHTTNPALREKMLNNRRAGKIMEQLGFLARSGITVHAQAVLCPEINDGAELDRTIGDLAALWPAVRSLAVVPVGLTRYREGLFPLRTYTREEAGKVISLVRSWQRSCRAHFGNPFVFAADEFYLLAGEKLPPARDYAGFPQVENGVGLVRLFFLEWAGAAKRLPSSCFKPKRAAVVTGVLGEQVLKPVVKRLNAIENLEVQLIGLASRFFGGKVTVAGLLTGEDLIAGLTGRDLGELVVVPAVCLRGGDDLFLDGLSLAELSRYLGVPAVKAKGPAELCRLLTGGE